MATQKSTRHKLIAHTGADHHVLMLLAAINGGQLPSESMTRYLAAARSILESPKAFDGDSDSPSIESFVLGNDGLSGWSEDLGKLLREVIDRDVEPFASTTEQVRNLILALVSESTLYGAAVMYEVLNGGTR